MKSVAEVKKEMTWIHLFRIKDPDTQKMKESLSTALNNLDISFLLSSDTDFGLIRCNRSIQGVPKSLFTELRLLSRFILFRDNSDRFDMK